MTHEFAIPKIQTYNAPYNFSSISIWCSNEYFDSLEQLRINSPDDFAPFRHLLSCDNQLPVAYFAQCNLRKVLWYACYETHIRLIREVSLHDVTNSGIFKCSFSSASKKPVLTCPTIKGKILLLDLSLGPNNFELKEISLESKLTSLSHCCWIDDVNLIVSDEHSFHNFSFNQQKSKEYHTSEIVSCFELSRYDPSLLGKLKLLTMFAKHE
jgi:hypothetical protein